MQIMDILQQAISEVSELVDNAKNNYYDKLANKLSNPSTSSKKYWSILETFCNNKTIPLILPILSFISNLLTSLLTILKSSIVTKNSFYHVWF